MIKFTSFHMFHFYKLIQVNINLTTPRKLQLQSHHLLSMSCSLKLHATWCITLAFAFPKSPPDTVFLEAAK